LGEWDLGSLERFRAKYLLYPLILPLLGLEAISQLGFFKEEVIHDLTEYFFFIIGHEEVGLIKGGWVQFFARYSWSFLELFHTFIKPWTEGFSVP